MFLALFLLTYSVFWGHNLTTYSFFYSPASKVWELLFLPRFRQYNVCQAYGVLCC